MRPPLLLVASFAALALGYLITTPPGSGYDEKGHHVRALAAGDGQWRGEPLEISAAERSAFEAAGRAGGGDPEQDAIVGRILRFQARTTRQFDVPQDRLDPRFGCTAAGPEVSAGCLDGPRPPVERGATGSAFGTYPPFVYLPPGLAARAASSPDGSVLAARAVVLIGTLALLAAAVALLWLPGAGAASLLGPAVVTTPTVLLLDGTLSTSGPEIAGAVCLAAALVRIVRDGTPPGWAWGAAAAGGVTLALARPLGPGFVLASLAAALLFGLRAVPRRGAAALAGVAAACAAAIAWQLAYQPSPERRLGIGESLRAAVERLPSLGEQAVGAMGGLDAPLPAVARWAWALVALALVVAAVAAAPRAERIRLGVLCAGVLAAVVALAMVLEEQAGGQGRYVLPLLVLVPLWAGDRLARGSLGARATRAAPLALAVLGAIHLTAFVVAGRRHATGTDGPWGFVGVAEWDPPAGWWPWLILAGAAAVALPAAGVLAQRAPR